MRRRGVALGFGLVASLATVLATPALTPAQDPSTDFTREADSALADLRHARFGAAYGVWSDLDERIPSVNDPVARFWFYYNAATSACYSGQRAEASRWAKAAIAEGLEPQTAGVLSDQFEFMEVDMARMRDADMDSPFWPAGEAYAPTGKLIEIKANGRLDEADHIDASLQRIRGSVDAKLFRFRHERGRINPLSGWGGDSGPSCEHGTSGFDIPKILRVSRSRGVRIRLRCTWVVTCRIFVRLQRVTRDGYVSVAGGNAATPAGRSLTVLLRPTRAARSRLARNGRFRLIADGTRRSLDRGSPASTKPQRLVILR